MSRVVKKPNFDSEVDEYTRLAEAKYGPLKRIDPNYKIPSKIQPYMKTVRSNPNILYSEISSPAHVPISFPIPEGSPPAWLDIYTLSVPGVKVKNMPLGKQIQTNKEGYTRIDSYEKQTVQLTVPRKGGYVGEGLYTDEPLFKAQCWNLPLIAGRNVAIIYAQSGCIDFNGIRFMSQNEIRDKNPHVVLSNNSRSTF